jgi:hypothetical protein
VSRNWPPTSQRANRRTFAPDPRSPGLTNCVTIVMFQCEYFRVNGTSGSMHATMMATTTRVDRLNSARMPKALTNWKRYTGNMKTARCFAYALSAALAAKAAAYAARRVMQYCCMQYTESTIRHSANGSDSTTWKSGTTPGVEMSRSEANSAVLVS